MIVRQTVINQTRAAAADGPDGRAFAATRKCPDHRTHGCGSRHNLNGMRFRPATLAAMRIRVVFGFLIDATRCRTPPHIRLLDHWLGLCAFLPHVDRPHAAGVVAII